MSQASAVGQVIFRQRSGVYNPIIMSDKGNLYQEYSEESSAPANIAPDFATLKPTLSFMATSSLVAEGNVVPTSIKWYFNDVLLAFTGNVSTNSLAGETGHFKLIPYQSGVVNYHGLQIQKNLVKASAGTGCTIKAVATVTVGNVTDEIQYVYPIPITKGVGDQKKVTIEAGDANFFAIQTKGGSVVLKAVARLGNGELSSGLSYKWYNLINGEWQVIASQTAKTLTVTDEMVKTSGIIKLEIYQGSNLIGMDTQTVVDLSDPYDIITNPTPADETIVSGSGGKVNYKPVLVKRGDTTTTPIAGVKLAMRFMDSAGNSLNTATDKTPIPGGGIDCTEEMCKQASGNVNWLIYTL